MGFSYILQSSLLKQAMEHDEIYEETWEDRDEEKLPYIKNDVVSTAFCYARYTRGMEEFTKFGMKNSLTLPSLSNKKFISLRDDSDDQAIYTNSDQFMGKFLRDSFKSGKCCAFNHHY